MQRKITAPVPARSMVNCPVALFAVMLSIYNYSKQLDIETRAVFEKVASSDKKGIEFRRDFDTAGSNTTASECSRDSIVL